MIQRSRIAALVLLAPGTAASLHGLARFLANRVPLRAHLGVLFWIVTAALAVSAAAGALAIRRELALSRRGVPRDRPLAPAGSSFVVLVAAWIGFLALVQPFQRLWFDAAAGLAAGAWAAWLLAEERRDRAPRLVRRIVGPACVSLAAATVLLEASLRVVAEIRPSPLLVRVGDAPRKLLERFRCRPGELHLGFPFNSGGHYDEEFRRRAPGEHLVASIGDSFSVGAVPHDRHFTTVAERALGVPVANLGAPGIGPPEYLRLLVDEVAPLDPDVVVACVFVGNDLAFAEVDRGLPDAFLRSFLERDSVLAWVLAQRLARIAAEERRRPTAPPEAARSAAEPVPWVDDPALEEPSMSEEAFLALEVRRALEVCRGAPPSLDGFRRAVLAMRDAAAPARLVVLLIPDEFQVEDDLWTRVQAAAGATLSRDRPQEHLLPWLASSGIEALDLLPAMRAVAPLEDGRRHLYHLRDTHWNARGNRVAGEALAAYLRGRLGPPR